MTPVAIDGSIAIVDDNDIERMIIMRVIAMSCLDNPVIEFSSGPAFLNALDDGSIEDPTGPALVLMDINMPGMTGFEVLPQIRLDRGQSDLLIAVMVASADAEHDISKALGLGANLCIAKQSGIESFAAEINANFRPVDI